MSIVLADHGRGCKEKHATIYPRSFTLLIYLREGSQDTQNSSIFFPT
jgi:hypothetical protein